MNGLVLKSTGQEVFEVTYAGTGKTPWREHQMRVCLVSKDNLNKKNKGEIFIVNKSKIKRIESQV